MMVGSTASLDGVTQSGIPSGFGFIFDSIMHYINMMPPLSQISLKVERYEARGVYLKKPNRDSFKSRLILGSPRD